MKKILLACLLILFILPTSNAFSITINGPAIFYDHRFNEGGPGDEGREILIWTGLGGLAPGDSPAFSINGSSGIVYLDDAIDFNSSINDFEKYYDAPNSSVLAQYENKTFTFDLYNSGSVVQSLGAVDTHTFRSLDPIILDNTPQGANPTFEWQDVDFANQYRVRLMSDTDPNGALIGDWTFAAGSGSYSFQYMGDLTEYVDPYFRLEAREFITSNTLNRSILFYDPSANPVPEPTTMLLFGAGLVGLAGFGRKKFKK